MEAQYGIDVTNPFSILDEDEDPLEFLKQQEEAAKTKKDSKKEPEKIKGKAKQSKKNVVSQNEQKSKQIDTSLQKKEGSRLFVCGIFRNAIACVSFFMIANFTIAWTQRNGMA